ncbi:MAG: alpha-L-fucosidase, partial [Planctomycetota bacterium]
MTNLRRWSLQVVATCLVLHCSTGTAEPPHSAIPPHPGVESAVKKIESVAKAGPFQPKWSSLEEYEIPQWYKDAKFGIFIH